MQIAQPLVIVGVSVPRPPGFLCANEKRAYHNYALVEIKLGGESLVKEGASTLMALREKIQAANQKAPSFCMILTAVGDAYTLDNGIHVVPINMLKD